MTNMDNRKDNLFNKLDTNFCADIFCKVVMIVADAHATDKRWMSDECLNQTMNAKTFYI